MDFHVPCHRNSFRDFDVHNNINKILSCPNANKLLKEVFPPNNLLKTANPTIPLWNCSAAGAGEGVF